VKPDGPNNPAQHHHGSPPRPATSDAPNDPDNGSKIRKIEEPKLGLSGKTYLPLFLQGLTTTLKHLFRRKVTVQSPEERHEIPEPLIYRGVHRLNRDEQGRVKCVACFLCATACPAHCIDIIAAQSPWPDREKYPESFQIDELRCIYCGMCEEACPVDAIELTSLYDLSGKSREEMIFDKEKLLSVFDRTQHTEPMRTERSNPSRPAPLPQGERGAVNGEAP
jgi:NADH-quinone oxidoreductase subunit I